MFYCAHCGTHAAVATAVYAPDDLVHETPFCCDGCQLVAALVHEQSLDRYYALRDRPIAPARAPTPVADAAWIEQYEQMISNSAGPIALSFDLQGIQCTACVWLLEAVFNKLEHGRHIEINSGRATVVALVERGFAIRDYVRSCRALGYVLRPSTDADSAQAEVSAEPSALVARMGVCAALALNAMIFALPLYLGLQSGRTYEAFRWIAFGLSTCSVFVGGSVFFRSGWAAVRRGVLHMDVPIAMGIIAAYGGSVYHHLTHADGAAYFDTVAVFIALMLFGRWLQQRAIAQNRRMLLSDDGIDRLPIRRIQQDSIQLVRYGDVRAGDRLLLPGGEPAPVDCVLRSEFAEISLQWILGESATQTIHAGDVLRAGTFNHGPQPIDVEASSDFAASFLRTLLQDNARPNDHARGTEWWQTLAQYYVRAVFVIALGGFAYWTHRAGISRGLEVLTALLVITCPCAFGLAAPLAYEIVQSKLRQLGLFVRSAGFLDRATSVRKLVFDKTGTLTTGQLTLRNHESIATLTPSAKSALFNLVARSSHPKASALYKALIEHANATGIALRFDPSMLVREVKGQGIEGQVQDLRYRVGAANWATNQESLPDDALVFSINDAACARIELSEELRPDARAQIEECKRAGYDVWILSGDGDGRVQSLAQTLQIDRAHALSAQSPEDKARWIAANDQHDVLFVGDGINDTLALNQAFCSGTPTIDRPFVAARCDFYFTTPGLAPVLTALRGAHALKQTNTRNLAAALAYNLLVIVVALAGRMSPLLCAIIMPISTLVLLAATWVQLGGSRASWMSSFSKPL
jgi:Cu2+-exporting ATPase